MSMTTTAEADDEAEEQNEEPTNTTQMDENTTEATEESESEENEEQVEHVWVNQSPDSRITGTPTELIYSGELGLVEQNDTSFGVIYEDVEVDGQIFENAEKPADGDITMVDGGSYEYHQTDYKIMGADEAESSTVNGDLIISTKDSTLVYEPVGEIAEDTILVWYNGMSGQIVGRGLDFNGRPYARWTETDDGQYMIKGLFQCAEGWRDTNSKKSMVDDDKAPRVARMPVLRDDLDQVSVRIKYSEYNDNAYWVEMGPNADEEFDDDDSMLFSFEADETLAENDIDMNMYYGDGWEDKPEGVENNSAVDDTDDEENPFAGAVDVAETLPDHLAALDSPERKFLSAVVEDCEKKNVTSADQISIPAVAAKFDDLFNGPPNVSALETALDTELTAES